MKRSKITELIAKKLFEQTKRLDNGDFLALTDFNDSKDEWMDDADETLIMLEELGMLPPNACESGNCGKYGSVCGNNWEDEEN